MTASPDARASALDRWLRELHPDFSPAQPMGNDASFRRYFRSRRDHTSYVVMDAPPEREDTGPFLRVASLLHRLGLRAPKVLAVDRNRGFLLLEDLGDQTFTHALASGVSEPELYRLAASTLVTLQSRWPGLDDASRLAPALAAYDTELLLREARLFVDWYWPEAHGNPAPAEVRGHFEHAWRTVLDAMPALPATLVLRDFHVDNLMLLSGDANRGTDACGLLDFQDAVLGSPAYDVVSLLEDARRDVSPGVVAETRARVVAESPWPTDVFLHHYHVLGAQRTVKIIGIFTRLARRDHKPAYQIHQPRLWRLLSAGLEHPELAPVERWFRHHFDNSGRPCTR